MAELLEARDAVSAADMVELRLDGVADLDVAGALRGRRLPAVVTCRPTWEGGQFDGTEERRKAILVEALKLGAEFVDVEWRAGLDDVIRRAPERIVLSSHDFDGVPADLVARTRVMRGTGAGLIKVAVAASRLTDSLPLLEIARGGNAVVIAMGEAGVPSRLLATRYGSRWTYGGQAVAPGQIPAGRMLHEFGFRRVGAATRLFGVVSSNAMHSLSPLMHNAAFAAGGIDAVYVPLRTTDFGDFVEYAAAMGVEGASITIPFKLDALRAAARVDDLTRSVGAANTLRRIAEPGLLREPRPATDGVEDDGGGRGSRSPAEWEATNTDVAGFLQPLEAVFPRPLQGARAAVLGAGGSARAVVVALLSRGAEVTVHARRAEQALEVTARSPAGVGAWPPPAGSWDLLVNCTPVGGAALRHESPLPDGPFDGALVYDLTYGPGESPLLRDARRAGCRTLDGLPMLIAQAERQFEWWTGQAPAPGVMRRAAETRLGTSVLTT